jgi:WD40 repeat protein
MTSRVKVDDKLAAKSPALQRARLAGLFNLVRSKKPEHLEKYFNLLTDFEFLTQKINHPEFGLQALIEDYDLIDAPEATTHLEDDPEKVKTLKRIQGALRLSAHVLAKDKTQLAGQLLGRLLPLPPVTSRQAQSQQKQADSRYFWEYIPWIGNFLAKYAQKDLTVEADPTATAPDINQYPIIQGLLEQTKQWKQSPWLRPLTPSLTPPGGQLLRTLSGHSDSVSAVVVTSDGLQAISASGDKTLKVWDLATGEERRTLKGHSDSVRAVAVTPDGLQAISASSDGTLKLWDLATGEERHTLKGHSDRVYTVAVTPDGLQAISASSDGTLKLWDLETGELIASFTGDGSIPCCAVAPDGVTLVAGEQSGRVHFLRLEGMEA